MFAFARISAANTGTGLRGDYNGDGKVGLLDVLAYLIAAHRTPDDPEHDLNGDGKVTLADALTLLDDLVRNSGMRKVEPEESDEFLLNPFRGFASTHCFNDWIARGVPRHPLCGAVQYRWYWDELEPREGDVRFDIIDQTLAKARANGQRLNFRVMCQDGVAHVPAWVRAAGAKGYVYTDGSGWQPEYNDPVFLEKHANLLKALGQRYDGHPDLDFVDIGTVGRWGEWHTSETGWPMPADSVRAKIIDMYFRYFPNTPLVMLIGGEYGLKYALERGAGWRADCLGDMGGFSATWNHMRDSYPPALEAAGAKDAWKKAPVVFETCWTMNYWRQMKWDIDYILGWALGQHATITNNGSDSIPADWEQKVREFEKKMGYRFVLRSMEHSMSAALGDSLRIRMEWENTGVAPCYLNFPLAIQLRSADSSAARVLDCGTDITGWLPGVVKLDLALAVPEDLPPGEYDLGVAMLDPWTNEPKIKFAVRGRSEDGWCRFSRVGLYDRRKQ